MYLAKSYPVEESISEHTDKLIDNYKILKTIYKDEININWDLLKLACLYHDLGKVNRVFQSRIKGEKVDLNIPDIPHGYLSVLFINYRKLMDDYNLTKDEILILINTVAHHHKRAPIDSKMNKDIKSYYDYLIEDAKNFKYDKLKNIQNDINLISIRAVNKSGISGLKPDLLNIYILTKGLLNKIDFAASGHYKIEYQNDFLIESMGNIKEKWGKDSSYNKLQEYMIVNRKDNIIAVAETGYGKTEAGLLWIGNNKGFFTLPLKSAINQIYERIVKDIITENIEERVGLLHSDTLAEYVKRNKEVLDENLLDYQEITNELSMPLTICTIDQIFDFVYKYIGFERKLSTLSYSKIVIDEIQMYSPDLVAYIIIALSQITSIGGKFTIITATFPPFIKDLLLENNIKFKMPEPFLYNDRLRHSIKIEKEEINGEYIYSKFKDNKVLVIVNTVKKLNELYIQLSNNYNISDKIHVFHSGFIQLDRMNKENQIIEFANKDKSSGIWICTQVAEASLDIDFDILITELSDLNGLFQRMGRCYRKRELDVDHNIYIFDGGKKLCSGVGYVNDKDIYNMSKEAIRNRGDGPISESEKINLINKVYCTDSLKNTKYYKTILNTIEYINSINYNEFSKKDVNKYFRNINSVKVIPKPVYNENKEKIDKFIEILSNKDKNYLDKKIARLNLDKYKLDIPYYLITNHNIEIININEYENLNIYLCEYSKSYGIRHIDVNTDMFF